MELTLIRHLMLPIFLLAVPSVTVIPVRRILNRNTYTSSASKWFCELQQWPRQCNETWPGISKSFFREDPKEKVGAWGRLNHSTLSHACEAFRVPGVCVCIFILYFNFLNLLVLLQGMWDCHPHPCIESVPTSLEVWRLNHWTTREVPCVCVCVF